MTTAIGVTGLTKRFGEVEAVSDVSFDVPSGRVVGLLGRNGAGKTTTLRMLLGLATPTAGEALVFGHRHVELPDAPRRVGAMLDGVLPIPGMTARRELGTWAAAAGVDGARVDTVLRMVNLHTVADRATKGFSTGMRQRLALAAALLPDPELLVLDEPVNGLDPDGIRWLRGLLRGLASQGRTVLVSSHMLAEVEQTVDDVVILQRTLRYAGPLASLTSSAASLEDRFFELVDAEVPA